MRREISYAKVASGLRLMNLTVTFAICSPDLLGGRPHHPKSHNTPPLLTATEQRLAQGKRAKDNPQYLH